MTCSMPVCEGADQAVFHERLDKYAEILIPFSSTMHLICGWRACHERLDTALSRQAEVFTVSAFLTRPPRLAKHFLRMLRIALDDVLLCQKDSRNIFALHQCTYGIADAS